MQKYTKTKDSGIEWIGPIPAHWSVKPLFALFRERQMPNYGNKEKNVLSLSYGKIIRRDVESNFGLLPESFETYNIIGPENIVLRLTDLQNDKRSLRCGFVGERGIITSAYLTLENRAKTEINAEYAFYLLHSYDLRKVFYRLGGGVRQAGKFEDLKRLPILLPPKAEQDSVVKYLKAKTSTIDILIQNKQKQLATLEEERAALLNQHVVLGLNSSVEFRDSGLAWLGKIPKHWDTQKLKYLAEVKFSSVNKKTEDGETPVKLCNYVDVYYNRKIDSNVDFMEATASPEEISRFKIKIGDVLITKDSEEWTDIGIPAYVDIESENLLCGYHLALIRPKNKLSGKFLFWLLYSEHINFQLRREALGVTRYGLSTYAFNNAIIPLPPLEEQEEISKHLEKQFIAMDNVLARIRSSINILKEYRNSLIVDSITGQINVRDPQ